MVVVVIDVLVVVSGCLYGDVGWGWYVDGLILVFGLFLVRFRMICGLLIACCRYIAFL